MARITVWTANQVDIALGAVSGNPSAPRAVFTSEFVFTDGSFSLKMSKKILNTNAKMRPTVGLKTSSLFLNK